MSVSLVPSDLAPSDVDEQAGSRADESLRLQILGPLRIWRGPVELDVGPRQQAYLLAVLLAQPGRPTSTAELIDLMWGDHPPASAVNVIHKYVGSLRRLLEPERPTRAASSYLLRRGNGYLCTAGTGVLDLATFRELTRTASAALAEENRETALNCYLEALALCSGGAGAGLTHGPSAEPIFAGVNDEFFAACVVAAELAVSLGRSQRLLPSLHLAAAMAPLHEPVQASLIMSLGAAGQQAEALSVFDTVRSRLTEELGIQPGPALSATHQKVLSQTLARPVERRNVELPVRRVTPPRAEPEPAPAGGLVGRTAELTVVRQAVESIFAGGTGVVLVEGEPGAGKTRLLEEIAVDAGQRGALVLWGHCLEGEGTPSMWPWLEVVRGLLDALPPAARKARVNGDLAHLVGQPGEALTAPVTPDHKAQFRLFEQVVAVAAEASAQRPLVLVLDDLQWADVTSLNLLDHLVSRLPARTAIVGALRNRSPRPGSELTRTLAAASRTPGHRRIVLGPLSPAEVAELVRRETGHDTSPGTARSIHARTAGNPFFVRELSQWLAGAGVLTEAAVLRSEVPATVRDVVRNRMIGLDPGARELLQVAALVGRNVELALLARVAGLDVETCLARLEPVEALGLLGPIPADPFSYRFTHDLVRQAVSETTSSRPTALLHLSIANALEQIAPDSTPVNERIAHHLWAAGPFVDPPRTVAALIRAGHLAVAKTALEAAERQFRIAVQRARTANLAQLELSALSQLIALVGMRSMYEFSSPDLFERAEYLARDLGLEVEAAGFLYSRWAGLVQGLDLERSGPLARRLLKQGEASANPFVLAYGLQAWGIQQWDHGNNGEAFRYLSRSRALVLDLPPREADPVRHDLQLLMTGLLAEVTALHGDAAGGQALLHVLKSVAGNDPYLITIWATMAVRIAAISGDPELALQGAELGIAADPEFSFTFLGTYQRLAQCWALALTGKNPADVAAEAERLIATNLLDPPRSCVATWYGLLGEMHLVAGALDQAGAALDRADWCLEHYGQRYPEGLLILLRARLLLASGEPIAAVRALAERGRALSVDRGTHLFAQRAERFLAELDAEPVDHR